MTTETDIAKQLHQYNASHSWDAGPEYDIGAYCDFEATDAVLQAQGSESE